jgi:hypothetical protein
MKLSHLILSIITACTSVSAFSVIPDTKILFNGIHGNAAGTRSSFLRAESLDDLVTEPGDNELEESSRVSSYLKFIGPYPSLPLRFPNLATESQLSKNLTGISLDFIIDTAANTNTINAQVAKELKLENVGSALPGYGASGALDGGDTFLLGDCTLDMPTKDLFMTNLTASALPVPSPAAAGLLGVTFLNCFEGGVKFEWGGGIGARDPLITFYGENDGIDELTKRMTRVDIEVLDQIYLPTVKLIVNGVEIPALLDTGSPVTVLNSAAAQVARLETITLESDTESGSEKGGFSALNPFKKISDNYKAAQSLSQAAQKGDILLMMGGDGKQIQLKRTSEKAKFYLGNDESDRVSFPSSYVYVGDLPGLKAMEGLVTGSPAAILGMDLIKKMPVMIYRGQQNELFFSA